MLETAHLLADLSHQYQQWKLRRARRKFNVYMRKQKRDPDRWVH